MELATLTTAEVMDSRDIAKLIDLNAMLRVTFLMRNDGIFVSGQTVGKQNLTMHAMRNL